MNTNQPIAQRTWHAIAADGREFSLVIRLGMPYEPSGGDWACPVAMEGLHERLPDIHGVDSLQTIELALDLVATLIAGFLKNGGRLFHEPGGEAIDPHYLRLAHKHP